jgi:tetratricopeptide (TPR) repeat protein
MADDEELSPLESGENVMLREATEALRKGDRARARDLLTRLLKTDQKNANYWIWLSATVDSQKERLYCLQTALQADPQNAAAKRGLILFGALPPDDSVPPFPINRPRLWEEKLEIPKEPREKLHGWANPATRVFMILGIAVLLVGLFVGGYMLLPKNARPGFIYNTRFLPTRTIALTPTNTPVIQTPTPTFLGATPLSYFLAKTYTPTPLYIITVHPVLSRASFQAGLHSLALHNYDTARVQFQEVLKNEPNAVDAYFYIGESYRAQGEYRTARDNYQEAINRDAHFAPAFLGRAQANLGLNPSADVSSDLDEAVNLDPKFVAAYIERGKYLAERNPSAAESDLRTALEISPDSALAYLYLADAQLAAGENDAALQSAQKANQIDMTLVPAYLALARAYMATGHSNEAISTLKTYIIYAPDDTDAFVTLGTAYNAVGDYQAAVDILNKAVDANARYGEAHFQRGFAYLNLNKANLAEADFKYAAAYDPTDFDSFLGLARAYDMEGKPGDAYIEAEQNAVPLAKTDYTKAQVYYYESLFLGEMNDTVGERVSWYRLIALPAESMPAEWRNQAFLRLNITPTPTPSTAPTRIPSRTPTP